MGSQRGQQANARVTGTRTPESLRTAAGKKKGATAHGHFRSIVATAK